MLVVERVAERSRDEPPADERGLLGCGPGEEGLDEGPQEAVALALALGGRQLCERSVGEEDVVDPSQSLDPDGVLADRSVPEPSSRAPSRRPLSVVVRGLERLRRRWAGSP